MAPEQRNASRQTLLLVDGDVLVRHELAEYLRHCGYEVIEAADTGEAASILAELAGSLDALLCDMEAIGERSGFELARWTRQHHPDIAVLLAGGPEQATRVAGELCDSGPELKRPYEPAVVLDRIRLRIALREQNRGG